MRHEEENAMPAPKPLTDAPIYQLKVTLHDSKPPIWRRIQVPGDISLAKLHRILQVALGWTDAHLHEFRVGGTAYGVPDREFGMDVKNEKTVRLQQVAPGEKARFTYTYDFGDDWEHDILVEKILPPDPATYYPRALAGARACPPEDSGGIWSYPELLEALRDPEHPEHEEMLEWVGEDFDPEDFDLEDIDAALRRMR
jgi:hypothetical protein